MSFELSADVVLVLRSIIVLSADPLLRSLPQCRSRQ